MTENVTAAALPPEESLVRIRRTAVLFLAYALACAAKAGLTAEQAAAFFKELRPQPHPAITTAAELEQFARDEAQFMALLHGQTLLERTAEGWSLAVPLSADRSILESFTTLDFYVRWGREFDRELRPGVRWETWLDGDTYRFEIRLLRAT